ncbi:helix-turn-helix domain-containing protein [Pseudomonas sp. LRF_L74]|uniref:AraC family transcriptional regulator n=1 Tax=Pseudomonas sp. LRF_L74 TaxID=3369422 RepID=UPI003F617D74
MTRTSAAPLSRNVSEQPWFVLASSQYSINASRHSAISHFYSFDVAESASRIMAIPDGCVDILFDCDAERPAARVCGTPLMARHVDLQPSHRYFGVRFTPGLIPAFVDVQAADLTEQEIDLQEVMRLASSMLERIAQATTLGEQMAIFNAFVDPSLTRKVSDLTALALQKIILHKGDIRVGQLEAFTGYTSRTLQKQFRQDTGIGPKSFCRIIRCQATLNLISSQHDISYPELAAELGFADQSHFLRDFKKLVSATPHDYRQRIMRESYMSRITFDE